VQLKKLPVENLFSDSGCYLETSSIDKENILPMIDLGIKFPSANHPRKEEFLQEKFLEKSWNISFFYLEKHINYGPLSSYKIWIFLKNMYANLSDTEKTKKNFMIVDISSDVYYQPDAIYEILSEEYGKKEKKDVLTEQMPFKIQENASSEMKGIFKMPSNLLSRPLFPASMSKFNPGKINGNHQNLDFELQVRKNSESSSNTGSNGLSTKYSSLKSNENVIVGLKPKKKRRDPSRGYDA
jgi:hypothetical protein